MKKIYTTLSFLLLFAQISKAQISYSFAASTVTYSSINGTTASLSDITGYGAQEEGYQNSIPIGFNFNYNGTNYSSIGVNVNGFAYFGQLTTIDDANNCYINGLASSLPALRPILAPFWEDTKYNTANEISYLTTGAAPNRVFTLQWNNMIIGWDYSNPTPTPALNMQLKLYETTGVIEFLYNQIPGGLVGSVGSDASGGASIGLSSSGMGSSNFLSLSNSGSSPTSSSTTENSTIQTTPANNQRYRFTPTFNLPITFKDFIAQREGHVVNIFWTTLTEINNKGFEIEKSVDGRFFSTLAYVPSLAIDGFSNSSLQYRFTDTKVLSIGNYYRFKQIDKDGKFSYSPVVYVKGTRSSAFTLNTLFPNPTKDKLTVSIQSPNTGNVSLIVADVTGKIIKRQTVSIVEGDNIIVVDVAALPSGTYFIKAICNNGCDAAYQQFSKQ
jgi:hypothetical protein